MTAGGPLRPYGAPPLGTGRKFRTKHIQRSRIRVDSICSPCKSLSPRRRGGAPAKRVRGSPARRPDPSAPSGHLPLERGGNSESSTFDEYPAVWLEFAPPARGAPAKRVRGSPAARPTTSDHHRPFSTTFNHPADHETQQFTPHHPDFSHTPPRKKFPINHQPSDAAAGPLRPFGAPPLGTGRKFRTEHIQRSRIRVDSICSPCKSLSPRRRGGAPAKQPAPHSMRGVRGSPLSSRTPAPPPSFPRRRESIQDQPQLAEGRGDVRWSTGPRSEAASGGADARAHSALPPRERRELPAPIPLSPRASGGRCRSLPRT